MVISSDCGKILSFKILRENDYLPSMIFRIDKFLFIIVFGQNFLNRQLIFIFEAHFSTN